MGAFGSSTRQVWSNRVGEVRVLELTVAPEPAQLARVRHQLAARLDELGRSEVHIWRVMTVASELLTLSISQGSVAPAVVRLEVESEATRIEVVDALDHLPVFDSASGRVVTRIASIWGVVRDAGSTRTIWCDIDVAG
ncbi:MAG: ATP-binding protein [Actinomycetota bacterium]